MTNFLLQAAAYNVWANKRIVEMLQENPTTLDTEIKSSFTSIRKTLHHIWTAEFIWLTRLSNQVLNLPLPAEYYEQGLDAFVANSMKFENVVKNATPDFLNATITYKNMAGDAFTSIKADIIQHCMNHSTMHRGQILTMLRLQGVDKIKSTDLIVYVRENK